MASFADCSVPTSARQHLVSFRTIEPLPAFRAATFVFLAAVRHSAVQVGLADIYLVPAGGTVRRHVFLVEMRYHAHVVSPRG